MDYKEKIIALLNDKELSQEQKEKLEEVFPELTGSEDEKVRKALVEMVHDFTGDSLWVDYNIHKEEALAWLEKQGEQKVSCTTLVETGNGGINALVTRELLTNGCDEQKLADKVVPKFKVGDWFVHNERKHIVKIINHTPFDCKVVNILGYHHTITNAAIENNYHLWTIQDAKDGDVLFIEIDGSTCIFKKLEGNLLYSYIISDGKLLVEDSHYYYETSDNIHPATKEQRDFLFKKMKEAGYEWDAEKKELKKISQRMVSAEAKEALYDKPAWSEEDDDDAWMNDIISKVENNLQLNKAEINWLKSFRPQNRWKPSDEQMEALEDAIRYGEEEIIGILSLLYNDLKKLREDKL